MIPYNSRPLPSPPVSNQARRAMPAPQRAHRAGWPRQAGRLRHRRVVAQGGAGRGDHGRLLGSRVGLCAAEHGSGARTRTTLPGGEIDTCNLSLCDMTMADHDMAMT